MQENIIRIVGGTEVIDNRGNIEKFSAQEAYRVLIDPEIWTADFMFFTEAEEAYDIDDLVGKRVQCGPFIFTVTED